MTQKLY